MASAFCKCGNFRRNKGRYCKECHSRFQAEYRLRQSERAGLNAGRWRAMLRLPRRVS